MATVDQTAVGMAPQGGEGLNNLESFQLKANAATDASLDSTRRMIALCEEVSQSVVSHALYFVCFFLPCSLFRLQFEFVHFYIGRFRVVWVELVPHFVAKSWHLWPVLKRCGWSVPSPVPFHKIGLYSYPFS